MQAEDEIEGFQNVPTSARSTESRGATSQDRMVPEENGGRSGQESNDPEESEDASDEVTDGAPEADATDKDEPPARSPEAAMEETSPTEPSGGPRSKKTADDLQKQKDLDARAHALADEVEVCGRVHASKCIVLYRRVVCVYSTLPWHVHVHVRLVHVHVAM